MRNAMAKHRRHFSHRRKLFKFRLKRNTVYTLFAFMLFAVAGLIGLSFGSDESVLTELNIFLKDYIGWEVYLLPLLLTSLSFLFLRLKFRFTTPNVTIGLLVSAAGLLGLTQAGEFGRQLFALVAELITNLGSYFLYTLITMTGLIILFNASLDQIVSLLVNLVVGIKDFVNKHLLGDVSSLFEKRAPVFTKAKSELKIKSSNQVTQTASSIGQKMQPIPETLEPQQADQLSRVADQQELASNVITNFDALQLEKWEYPPLSLLNSSPGQKADHGDIKKNADIIEKTLDSFGIRARVVEVNIGPAVTQYALDIALGTKLSKITALSNDLALALAAPTGQIRIEAPIPGRSLVGVEVPNRTLEFVTLHKMLTSDLMLSAQSKLIVALGLDVAGNPVVTDIAKMPHVLIAGTTGAGKSVLLNTWIASILYRTTPAEVRFILVDPKRVELTIYNGIPHLLTEVIVEPKEIVSALRWSMGEMERRYKEFAQAGARNIAAYNEQAGFKAMPYIVIVVDELADLMAFAPTDVEDSITRLAQMARATGIHLVISTQRPSVDVITGLMKANIPARIAFNVSSHVDSRVIIDQVGAEKLLGRGDMLYIPPDQAKPTRIQGVYVSDDEIRKLVDFLKREKVTVQYTQQIVAEPVQIRSDGKVISMTADERDGLFDDALQIICRADKASASMLQRKLSIGYARAARLLDQLHAAGVVGPPDGAKPRDVLIHSPEQFHAREQEKMVGGN